MNDSLLFLGTVSKGAQRFAKELVVPGARDISVPIRDWPDVVEPGTLNVRILKFPDEFVAVFGKHDVGLLDTRKFAPEAELPYQEIKNNTLPPTASRPDRGNAQIWPALLTTAETGSVVRCWVLRRIGSGYSKCFECVAGVHLRTTAALAEGDKVSLMLQGTWEPVR